MSVHSVRVPRFAAMFMGLLLCGVGLGLGACSTGGTSSNTTGSTVVATTTATTSGQTILNRAEHSALKDTSFTISATAGGGSGPVPPNAANVNGQGALTMSPHRTKYNFTAIGLFGVSAPAQVIIDEHQNVYANVPPLNQWVKVDPSQLQLQIGTLDILNYSAISDPVLIGTETINQQVTWHVQGVLLAQTAAATRRLEDVWIRQSDAYPVKIEIHTVPDPNGTPTTDNRTLDVTLLFQQWDTGITITLPSNVISP
jgi:hypothetical protein